MTDNPPITFWDRKKEPIVVITQPFGAEYHVNLEWDMWQSHVGVYTFKRTAVRKARKALKQKLEEYHNPPEKNKIVFTEQDLS